MEILRFAQHDLVSILLACLFLTGCATTPAISTPEPTREPQVRVVAEGLLGPIGLAVLPDGSLLVAEAGHGEKDDSSGVSLIRLDGQVGRLISGLPSSRDSGDLAGVNFAVPAPDGGKIYIGNFGPGHLWTLPLSPEGLSLPDTPLTSEALTPEMGPLNNARLTNPFDLTFDPEGVPVVSDASGNGVAKENPDGTTRFIHRFEPLPNTSTPTESDTIEAVPTGITRIGPEYYVTLTGGCPYPQRGGRLVAIDEARNQRAVVDQLNMPIDVAQGPDGTIWLLEFARFKAGASCFTGEGYQAKTGRLSQLRPDGSLATMMDGLNLPGAVLPVASNRVYISEVFSGRVIEIVFPE